MVDAGSDPPHWVKAAAIVGGLVVLLVIILLLLGGGDGSGRYTSSRAALTATSAETVFGGHE